MQVFSELPSLGFIKCASLIGHNNNQEMRSGQMQDTIAKFRDGRVWFLSQHYFAALVVSQVVTQIFGNLVAELGSLIMGYQVSCTYPFYMDTESYSLLPLKATYFYLRSIVFCILVTQNSTIFICKVSYYLS